MKRFLFTLATLSLLSLSLAEASTYIRPPVFESINSGAAYSVCQDGTGTIWINSSSGLYRYCGTQPRRVSRPLITHGLACNGDRLVYAVSYQSVLRFDVTEDSHSRLSNPGIDYPECVFLAEEDSLLLASDSVLYHSAGDTLLPLAGCPGESFVSMIRSSQGALLLASNSGAIYSYAAGVFNKEAQLDRTISALYQRPGGNYLVGFATGGFAELSAGFSQVRVWEKKPEKEVPNLKLRSFCSLPDGSVLIGAADGLFRLLPDGECVVETGGVPRGEAVWEVFRDRNGNIWVSTFYNGVYFRNGAYDAFSPLDTGDLSLHQVSAMVEDVRGDVWVFTDNYGMFRLGSDAGQDEEIASGSGIKFQAALYDDKRDGIWAGEFQGHLRYYDIPSSTWEDYYFHDERGVQYEESVQAIVQRDGALLLGTNHGCFVFDPDSETFVSRKLFPYDRPVYSITEYGDSSLVFSSLGVLKYDCRTHSLVSLPVTGHCANAVASGDTLYVCVTGRGVARLINGELEDVVTSGLSDNSVGRITPLPQGRYLVGNRSGLALIGPGGKVEANYSCADGMGLGSIRGGCFLKRGDGAMWIGGKNGIEIYSTVKSQPAPLPGKPSFDMIFVNNSPRNFGTRLPFLKSVELQPGERNFSVQVEDFDLFAVTPVYWRYRLEDFDEDWTPFDPALPIIYMNVPEGRYRLVAQYSGDPGFANPGEISLRLRLRAPWYATKLAKSAYALAVLLVIVLLLYFLYSRMMLRQRLNYEEEESRRRTRLFVDISRQLRTPLTLILGDLETFFSRYGSSANGMKYIESTYSKAKEMSGIISGYVDLENKYEPVQQPHLLRPAADSPLQEVDLPPSRRHPEQMLIVSDNPEMTAMLRGVLGEEYDILVSSSAAEALSVATSRQPDIIVCDLAPDSSDELGLAAQLRSKYETSHIPFVLITAHASEQRNLESVLSGVDAFIIKPFKTELLVASCRSLLENRRILQEKYALAGGQQRSSNRKDLNFLNAAIGAVERNLYSEGLNVSRLCSELNMSKTSLTEKLYAATEMSPRDFIEDIRLRHAAQMLLDGTHRVSEIADELGFSSAKYFTIRFKKRFGVPPSSYGK
ncbi:MAG: helix-turn-helix domain-containing protein [Bacteroidales bacterium]|nr:helix-turn-helix domain-containing protein [Bacteroidales bacterium]